MPGFVLRLGSEDSIDRACELSSDFASVTES